MVQVTALQLNRCLTEIIRQAFEYYLDYIEDLRCGVAARKDPADPVLNWADVRHALLAADAGRLRGVEAIDLLCEGSAANW